MNRRSLGALAVWAAGCAPAVPLPAAEPCGVTYVIAPRYDASPRALDVELRFAASGRTETHLFVQSSWSGIEDFAKSLVDWRGASDGSRIAPIDHGREVRVLHPPGGDVRVRFRALGTSHDPDADVPQEQDAWYRTQIGRDWFQFYGHGALPVVDEREAGASGACIVLAREHGRLVGGAEGGSSGESVVTVGAGVRSLWHTFYAGGPGWRVAERATPAGRLRFALRGTFPFADAAFVDKAAQMVEAQERFWADTARAPGWWVLTPNRSDGLNAGTVVSNATVLAVSRRFAPDTRSFEFLVAHEGLHRWIPNRLGSVSTNGDGTTTWFSEGLTEYVTRRLLLRSGIWSAEQYATALTRILQRQHGSPLRNATVATLAPRLDTDRDASDQLYTRGEVLAYRWAAALRAAGGPALDDVLRGLLLPPTDQPQKQPPAVDRLFAALAPWLGDTPRRDVQRFAFGGEDLPLEPGLLGTGFEVRWTDVDGGGRWPVVVPAGGGPGR